MSVVITGANGHLGRLVVESLLDAGLARGEPYTDSDDLPRLIGRAATTRRDSVRAALTQGGV